ncbi:MAG: RrF2 family transcriptional regulator [Candidatus Aminicenantales bacterium]
MNLINRDTDYAIKALMYIAKERPERVSVSELAKESEIPHPFLRKILQILNKKGVLNSYKGKSGGFLLALRPDQIFLADLIKIFQGPVKMSKCIFKEEICPHIGTCALKKKIDALEKHVVSELKSITLASLLDEESSFLTNTNALNEVSLRGTK